MGEGHEQMSRYVTWCLGTVLLAVLLVASVIYPRLRQGAED